MPSKKIKPNINNRKRELPRVSVIRKIGSFARRSIAKPRVLGSLLILSGIIWLHLTGIMSVIEKTYHKAAFELANVTGLTLQNVYLEGQNYTDPKDILSAIKVKIGQPLLSIDIWKTKKYLEELTWVRYAVIERQFPSTLSVRMIERQPAALWQNGGIVQLIDKSGKTINAKDLTSFSDLIILVGKDAPTHANSFIEMIRAQPDTEHLVSAAIRVGQRRWNIKLYNDIEIRLPEKNPEKAWKFISEKHKTTQILDDNIQSIDLKVPNKMFIKRKV